MEAGGAKKAGEGTSLLGGIDPNLFVLFVFALVIPFALGTADRIFGDGDVSWHIAAGQWMISHGKVRRGLLGACPDPLRVCAPGSAGIGTIEISYGSQSIAVRTGKSPSRFAGVSSYL